VPIGVHLTLSVIAYMTSSLGGFMLGGVISNHLNFGDPWALAFICAGGGLFATSMLFQELIPARCPNCKEMQSYQRGHTPAVYVCKSCELKHITNVSMDSDGY